MLLLINFYDDVTMFIFYDVRKQKVHFSRPVENQSMQKLQGKNYGRYGVVSRPDNKALGAQIQA